MSRLSSAGHIVSSAWIGLNDINTENTFLYTDGTTAVSDEALDVLVLCRGMTTDFLTLSLLSGLPPVGAPTAGQLAEQRGLCAHQGGGPHRTGEIQR